jgi:hypothetical protein
MFRADFPPFALETVEHSRHLPIRRQIQHLIYIVRGDHDEATWLRQLLQSQQNKTIPIDPFDLFHYVPDGIIIHSGGLKLHVKRLSNLLRPVCINHARLIDFSRCTINDLVS